MDIGSAPRVVTSARRIRYRRSQWSADEFEVWSGGAICRCAALIVKGSLLVWMGDAGGAAQLSEAALAVPAAVAGGTALATALLGPEGSAAPLAARLAAALSQPVYVCSGATFDRFTLPLVERALVNQIKSRPECF